MTKRLQPIVRNADKQSEDKAMMLQLIYRRDALKKEYNNLPRKSSFSGLAILDELNKIEELIP